MEQPDFFKKPDSKRTLKVVTSKSPSSLGGTNSSKHNPMLSEACLDLLNYRIEQEEYSSRLYLSMSMWLSNRAFKCASVWKTYSEEEQSHADWAKTYLLSMGVQPDTPALDAPGNEYAGLPDIIRKSFDHELEITKQCKELADAAMTENDHMLYTLTHKYLAEQVEEHNKMQDLVDQLDTFGEDKIALRLLDNAIS